MCGIFGYVGPQDPVPIIMGGLRSLEYRGYDSAGIAIIQDEKLQVRRSSGKLKNLEELLTKQPLTGQFGLGHTRWATHGRPTEENAHPHRDCKGRIVVAHNGIIENYLALKRKLRDRKSTRLNSSHVRISYAVFCLKKKKKNRGQDRDHV